MTTGVRNVLGRNLIGLSAPRALTVLLRSLEDVAEVYLAELRPLPPLQDRFDLTAAEHTVLKSALKHRSHKGLSFWDAVLLELPGMPEAIRLIDAAMMHVSLRGQERPLSRSLVVAGALERACEEYLTTQGVSLTFLSEVRCRDGSLRHLPMLDFHAFASDSNRLLIEAIVKRLFPEGAVLLESGESYHAYGAQLLPEAEFRRFLGRALLCAPIVDRAYLAHQWIEGRCALRLTPGGGKSRVPAVVSVIPGM
jgi:hypothetical protein